MTPPPPQPRRYRDTLSGDLDRRALLSHAGVVHVLSILSDPRSPPPPPHPPIPAPLLPLLPVLASLPPSARPSLLPPLLSTIPLPPLLLSPPRSLSTLLLDAPTPTATWSILAPPNHHLQADCPAELRISGTVRAGLPSTHPDGGDLLPGLIGATVFAHPPGGSLAKVQLRLVRNGRRRDAGGGEVQVGKRCGAKAMPCSHIFY